MVEYSLNQKIADGYLVQMRLGKTLADVREVQERDEPYPQLCIAPGNVMNAWEKELTLEGEDFIRGYSLNYGKRVSAVNYVFNQPKRTWLLINYESIRSIPGIVNLKWGKVRLDESIKIKDPKTQTGQLIADGFKHTRYRGIRTGLIAPEHELDIFQQMKFMHGSFLNCKTYWTFRSKFFHKDGYDWFPNKNIRSTIKTVIHERCIVRSRKDVGLEKIKIHQKRITEMNATQKKLYKMVETEFAYELDSICDLPSSELPAEYIETIWATGKALWLARIAGGFTPNCEEVISTAKIDDIIECLNTDLKGEPAVIYYRFLEELFHDRAYLEERGISTAFFAGQVKGDDGQYRTTKFTQRFAQEEKFNSGKARVLLCMQKAVARGKDFSRASVAFYRSEEYSTDIYIQSEDRILNMMKEDNGLLYIHCLCNGTVDIAARQAIDEKAFNARDFMYSFRRAMNEAKDGQKQLPSFEEFMREIANEKYYEKVL